MIFDNSCEAMSPKKKFNPHLFVDDSNADNSKHSPIFFLWQCILAIP